MTRPILLIFDDDLQSRVMLEILLKNQGDEVYIARDRWQAIKLTKERNIEVIVAEYQMTGFKGIEFLHQLRKIRPDLKAVLLSSRDNLEKTTNAETVRECILVAKPFDASQLLRAVNEAVELS